MIRGGFLSAAERKDLVALARDGTAEHRLARRANALVLLDRGWSCESVGDALLLDDDMIRTWYRVFKEDGIEGLASFGYEGSSCLLSCEQQDALKAWITETLPRTTREVGAWIESEFGISYRSRSGLIVLLHRLGMEHRKPVPVSSKLDEAKQKEFIETYQEMQKRLPDDEVVLFVDAVHPTYATRPTGCWAPKNTKIAVDQTSGRQRLNIHGTIDLVTGMTKMIEVITVNAANTIVLLLALELMFPKKWLIHVFLDNARYYHAKVVRKWLARRIRLHFTPAYCPHLNPIECLWVVIHKKIINIIIHITSSAKPCSDFSEKKCQETGTLFVITSPTTFA